MEIQQLSLFRSMLLSSSRTALFYKTFWYHQITSCRKDLVTRIRHTCQKYDISLVKFVCNDKYGLAVKQKIKKYPVNDGVVDSVKQLVSFRSVYNTWTWFYLHSNMLLFSRFIMLSVSSQLFWYIIMYTI